MTTPVHNANINKVKSKKLVLSDLKIEGKYILTSDYNNYLLKLFAN